MRSHIFYVHLKNMLVMIVPNNNNLHKMVHTTKYHLNTIKHLFNQSYDVQKKPLTKLNYLRTYPHFFFVINMSNRLADVTVA